MNAPPPASRPSAGRATDDDDEEELALRRARARVTGERLPSDGAASASASPVAALRDA
jgi:hypothetical protein